MSRVVAWKQDNPVIAESSQELNGPSLSLSLNSTDKLSSEGTVSEEERMRKDFIHKKSRELLSQKKLKSKSTQSILEAKQKRNKEAKKHYEVDYVGNGSFQPSELNLLNPRSNNVFPNGPAALSARGLHHRSREIFLKEVKTATFNISSLTMTHSKTEKGRCLVFAPIFQRAIARERLGDVDGAIQDYDKCIAIAHSVSESSGPTKVTLAAVYANRAGLLKVKGETAAAMEDIRTAIELDASNLKYRETLCLLHRTLGQYSHAAEELIAAHAIYLTATSKRGGRRPDSASGGGTSSSGVGSIDWKQLSGGKKDLKKKAGDAVAGGRDHLMAALQKPPGEGRTDTDIMHIVDFMKTTKIFSAASGVNEVMLKRVASSIALQSYVTGQTIFQEGDKGDHFFIILDGEVSIVKKKLSRHGGIDLEEEVLLVRLFRGSSFGEAALENTGGLRSAGAVAAKPTRLLCMAAKEYQTVLTQTKEAQKQKVHLALLSSPLFCDWEHSKLDMLAGCAMVRNYNPNTEVFGVGDSSPHLMMIVTGVVTLLKPVAVPTSRSYSPPRSPDKSMVSSSSRILRKTLSFSSDAEEAGFSFSRDDAEDSGEEGPFKRFAAKGERSRSPPLIRLPRAHSAEMASKPKSLFKRSSTQTSMNSPQLSRKELDEHLRSVHRSLRVKERKLEEVPGLWVLEKTWSEGFAANKEEGEPVELESSSCTKNTEFVVAVLGSGQVFGESTILNPKFVSPVSAVAYTALEIYCFEVSVLIALGIRFRVETMAMLQDSYRLLNTPVEKLIYYYNAKFNWEQKKRTVMTSLKLKLKNSHKDS